MTLSTSQSSTEDAQSVEQLLLSLMEVIREQVRNMEPEQEAQYFISFASSLTENKDIKNLHKRIEKAIYWYRRALQIWSRESYPKKWAFIQFRLGNISQQRTFGSRRVNIDESIDCYQLALQIRTRESMPYDWAMTQMNMGVAFRNRVSGSRQMNINKSIECYRLALQIYTRESMPQNWATAQISMGIALWNRISGDRRTNINEAIECYRLALQVYTPESMSHMWAMTQMNMGLALGDRISGDRKENIDESIECYQRALQIYTRESRPQEWAVTQMNMGNALGDRVSGDRRENIDESIKCYRQALQIYTKQAVPQDWALTMGCMGNALRSRISGDRKVNIDESIEQYQSALQIWTRKESPLEWAKTQLNMGIAFRIRISGDRRVNIDESIDCYRRVLEIYTRESMPYDWALTQMNMGRAYLAHVAEGRSDNLPMAKYAIENFFDIFSLEMDPRTFLRGCSAHTQLYLHIGSVPEIIVSCERGLQALAYAKSLSSAGLLHSRHLDEQYATFGINLISLHFHEKQYQKVLEVFDQNKGSLVLSLISQWDECGSKLSEEDRSKLEELKSSYRSLKYELDLKTGKGEEYEEVMEEFRRVQADIDSLIRMDYHEHGEDVLGVSCREMIEFVKRKNVIGIVFFYTGKYERLRNGDSSKVLHATCIWNGKVSRYMNDEELKYERSYESAKMFSHQMILRSERESLTEWKKRRTQEKEFLKKIGNFISHILDDLKTDSAATELPNRLVTVPHHILTKAPFCAVPVRTGFDGYSESEPRFLGDVFRGGIWMLPSMSIGVRIDWKKANKEAKELGDCKIVSATCPSVFLREHYNKTLREEIGRQAKTHVHIEEPYPPGTKIKMKI